MGGGFTHGNNKQAIAAAWTMDATYCSRITILYLIRCHVLIAGITSAACIHPKQLEN